MKEPEEREIGHVTHNGQTVQLLQLSDGEIYAPMLQLNRAFSTEVKAALQNALYDQKLNTKFNKSVPVNKFSIAGGTPPAMGRGGHRSATLTNIQALEEISFKRNADRERSRQQLLKKIEDVVLVFWEAEELGSRHEPNSTAAVAPEQPGPQWAFKYRIKGELPLEIVDLYGRYWVPWQNLAKILGLSTSNGPLRNNGLAAADLVQATLKSGQSRQSWLVDIAALAKMSFRRLDTSRQFALVLNKMADIAQVMPPPASDKQAAPASESPQKKVETNFGESPPLLTEAKPIQLELPETPAMSKGERLELAIAELRKIFGGLSARLEKAEAMLAAVSDLVNRKITTDLAELNKAFDHQVAKSDVRSAELIKVIDRVAALERLAGRAISGKIGSARSESTFMADLEVLLAKHKNGGASGEQRQ